MVDGFVSFISCPGPAVAYSHITCLDVILYVEMNRGSITGSGSMALRQTIRDLTVLHAQDVAIGPVKVLQKIGGRLGLHTDIAGGPLRGAYYDG